MAITRLGPNQDITAAKIAGTINFKNLIINGDMSIAQRGTSQASISSAGYYTVDRFRTTISSLGTWTQSQSTDVPTGQGFANSLKMECTTADASPSAADYLILYHYVEAQNCQLLKFGTSNAESLTLSFWVKSNKTGILSQNIRQVDGGKFINNSYTINSANTWEKKTLNFVGNTTDIIDNDNGAGFQIEWWLDSGSNYRGGTPSSSWHTQDNTDRNADSTISLADTIGNTWYITGIQLEADTSASDFEFIPYDVNLQRCQRYYQIFGSTAPTSCNMTNGMAYSANSSEVFCPTILPVVMRTGPSVTQNGTIAYRTPSGTTNVTLNSTAVSEKEVFMNFSGSFTSGEPGYIRNPDGSSSNYLEVDAEL
jgi:hypothetical protein